MNQQNNALKVIGIIALVLIVGFFAFKYGRTTSDLSGQGRVIGNITGSDVMNQNHKVGCVTQNSNGVGNDFGGTGTSCIHTDSGCGSYSGQWSLCAQQGGSLTQCCCIPNGSVPQSVTCYGVDGGTYHPAPADTLGN